MAERFAAAAEPLTEGALGDLVVREDGRIRHVVVDGRLVVEDGRLTGADMAAITAAAESGAQRLFKRMRDFQGH